MVKGMKVLILGANGYLGPHVVKALAADHRLRVTDIKPPPTTIKEEFGKQHEFFEVDVTSVDQVMRAAQGMDAIVNLSVVRSHRRIAFGVNVLGCHNVMRAAVEHDIRRVINTGPHFTVTGPMYEGFDHGIVPDIPPHSGTNLYAISKSLGQEVCRAYTADNDIYVLDFLFYNMRFVSDLKRGAGGVPFMIAWPDAGEVFRLGLAVDLKKLPSRCEVFFIHGDNPQGKFLLDKTKNILGFEPKEDVSVLWRKNRNL